MKSSAPPRNLRAEARIVGSFVVAVAIEPHEVHAHAGADERVDGAAFPVVDPIDANPQLPLIVVVLAVVAIAQRGDAGANSDTWGRVNLEQAAAENADAELFVGGELHVDISSDRHLAGVRHRLRGRRGKNKQRENRCTTDASYRSRGTHAPCGSRRVAHLSTGRTGKSAAVMRAVVDLERDETQRPHTPLPVARRSSGADLQRRESTPSA
jgi:hypothetical protein